MNEALEKLISLAKEDLNERTMKIRHRDLFSCVQDTQKQQNHILKLCKNVEMFVKAKSSLELAALSSKRIDAIHISNSDEIMTVLYEMSLISPFEYSTYLLQNVTDGDFNEKSEAPTTKNPNVKVKWQKMKKTYGIK